MKVAVLTLTRDRLEYTQHCFASLRRNAGIAYVHLVLDQGSQDGTAEWLRSREADVSVVCPFRENLGISQGMNRLLDLAGMGPFDVIVKFDNDCELTQPNTLRDVARLALEGNCLLSPRIAGLNNPPAMQGMFLIGDEEIIDIPQIGGIFMAVPAHLYESFRYSENGTVHSLEDVEICWWFRGQGGRCGYVKRLVANHYETTSGQHARYPEYFQRTLAEGKPAL